MTWNSIIFIIDNLYSAFSICFVGVVGVLGAFPNWFEREVEKERFKEKRLKNKNQLDMYDEKVEIQKIFDRLKPFKIKKTN